MFTEARSVPDSFHRQRAVVMGRWPSKVLLVDDDIFMLGVLDDMLREFGATSVTKTMGGMAALAALDAMCPPPDLVLCDLNMPGGGGLQFMQALSTRGFKGAVVPMSGMRTRAPHSVVQMEGSHRLKVAGTLRKPVSASALEAVLGSMRMDAGAMP
jgi:CheY-like chemotaxis protein